MNHPDRISESLESIFWDKILHLFYAYPGSGIENIRIWDHNTGYVVNVKKSIPAPFKILWS
jgi:hypothetical protein